MVAIGIVVLASNGFTKSLGERALNANEIQARTVLFTAAGILTLPAIVPAERQIAVSSMRLSAAEQAALQQHDPELVWLTIWDDLDEDGDTVAILSAGFRQVVRLANAPVRIAVPRPQGGIIAVQGILDGGGGITIALASDRGPVALPVLTVGQTIDVPVR